MTRVEIPVYCDLWMRGARYGVIDQSAEPKDGRVIVYVRLDRLPRRRIKFYRDELREAR